jgi:hypothetical protein
MLPVTPRTPGGGRHGPDGAGRHLAKPVERLDHYAIAMRDPEGNEFDIN